MNKEVDRIKNQLERAYSGEAWHGPSLLEIVSGIEPATAVARPLEGAHSIEEILAHVVTWQEEAARRLEGKARGDLPEAEDWPESGAFPALVERLKSSHEALCDAISELTDDMLDSKVKGRRESYYVLLHGVIQHNLYHAGQIAILKKALAP